MKACRLLLLLVATATTLSAAVDLYVAPQGNDSGPGTRRQPFATLTRARDEVRALKQRGLPAGGVTVNLRGGTYPLAATLELTAADGGTAEAPVVWRAEGREPAWLTGATRLDAKLWRPVTDPAILERLAPEARGKVVQCDLAAAGVPADVDALPDAFRGFTGKHPVLAELFCDGQRLTLARWPNEGFAHFGDIVDPGSGLLDPKGPKRPGRFKLDDDRIRRWRVDDGVWLNGYWARAYLIEAVRVGKIDVDKHEVEWAVPLGYGLDTWGARRFYAFNTLAELDSPGEWYLDRKTHLLYLWPAKPLAQSTVAISALATPLVSVRGADWLTFRGLGFEGGRQNAVNLENCNHCRVIGCTIRNVGMDGVVVTGGVDDGVAGCDIHDTGYGGVRLSGGDRKTLTPCGHFADNNHIHHTSIVRRTHAGPISLTGVGLRAAHNLIHDEPHTAVWYNGNDLLMAYNEIYQVLTDTTEGGVFYTGYDWTYRGNVIRYNYVHHINDVMEGCGSEAVVLHLDDCVSGTTFQGNFCYRTGDGAVMCGGPDNVADNNLFVDCKTGAVIEGRGLDWWHWTKQPDGKVTVVDTRNGATMNNLLVSLTRVPYQQPPWTKYPHLADILERDPAGAPYYCAITRNIAVGGKLKVVQNNVKPEWVTVRDNWDNAGDPGFVDAAHGNYRLRPDAPVLKQIGFEPLPFDQMGLVNDGTRATWPVKADPPPADFLPHWLGERELQRKAPTALPAVRVPRAAGPITIDGAVGADEWNPAPGPNRAANDPLTLGFNYDGKPAPLPSKAWLASDDRNLYVAFVNDTDPGVGVSGGTQWGKDDAVEVALAAVDGDTLAPTVVLRGYTNGQFVSSDEAGAPGPVVQRALQGTQYACRVLGKQQWTAEWKIPYTALGLDPAKRAPKLLFNLSVRKPKGDLWVMWMRGGGTWDVRKGGVLWLEPFGDVQLGGLANAGALLYVRTVTPGLTMKGLRNCTVPGWATPPGTRVVAEGDRLTDTKWHDYAFTFAADRDGEVSLEVCGPGYRNEVLNRLVPVWTYYDELSAEGATLRNGGAEELDAQGRLAGWSVQGGLPIADAKVAAAGQRCFKAWHDGRFVQTLTVRKDQPVTIRMKVRGEPKRR